MCGRTYDLDVGSRIIVINPNSTAAVTHDISSGLDSLRLAGGPEIECHTLASGPPAVETDDHIAQVIEPMCSLMEAEMARGDAFVIACYSDPGLDDARERFDVPVFGIAESAMAVAITRGRSFGVVSLFQQSVDRHVRRVEALGLASRMACDLPLDLGVLDLADESIAYRRIVAVAKTLRDEHRADVVILGCTGMAPYRRRLETHLGMPVIDPTQAAVTLAIGSTQVSGD